MKQFIVQLAAGWPPPEGSPFAFGGNDNSCFGWRELGYLSLYEDPGWVARLEF